MRCVTPMEVVSGNGAVPQSQMSPQLSGRKKSIVPAAVPLASFGPVTDEPQDGRADRGLFTKPPIH